MPDSANGTAYGGFDRQFIARAWRHGSGEGRLADRDPFSGDTLL